VSTPATTTMDAYHAAVVSALETAFGEQVTTYARYDPANLVYANNTI